jgi:uridine monophosphate synthetase
MISYQQKLDNCTHIVSKKLLRTIIEKKSNLSLSADVTSSKDLISLIKAVGKHIAVLKTHIDIISDFKPSLTNDLRALAQEYNFLIFEDRKFADIGNTVLHQVKHGIYQISNWADIINAHTLPGEGIIEGLKSGCNLDQTGLLLLAQMSSKGNLFSDNYTKTTVNLAEKHSDFVMGFIAQEKLSDNPDFITMTPGVNFSQDSDGLSQNYNTPDYIIGTKHSDMIIVGRGIYANKNPKLIAHQYQEAAWEAYLQSL